VFFEVPFWAVETFFYGRYTANAPGSKVVTSTFQLPNPTYSGDAWPFSFQAFEYWYPGGVFTKLGTLGSSIMCPFKGGSLTEVEVSSDFDIKYAISKSIYYQDLHKNKKTITDYSSSDGSPYREWHFDYVTLNPLYGSIDPSRSSFTGSMYVFYGDNTYFNFTATSAVGWA
jgi:hypothetical protein